MKTDNLILGIVNHRYANIHSVKKALNYINCNHIELNNPSDFNNIDAIILPGVGAFDAAMQVLKKSGMANSLIKANLNKTPIFGICLGMQLLFEKSEEGSEKGLGLIEGSVKNEKITKRLIAENLNILFFFRFCLIILFFVRLTISFNIIIINYLYS